ncbi:MAG: hypothetical protein WBG50_26445 [Desulfomonilaceae bacterium]
MPEVKEVEFEVKFPARHVEFNFPWEESIDSLHREGFQYSFQIQFLTCLLERWDHPDGRYKLVAYKGGGIYVSEDVNDPQWKEIIGAIFDDRDPPVPLVLENWFEFEIIDHERTDGWGTSVRRLSSNEIPATSAEWEKLVRSYHVDQGQTTFSLRNGRTGETVFSDTLRKGRDGSVKILSRKKRKSSP